MRASFCRKSGWAAFVLALTCSGCASVSIDDLTLSSVQVVDRYYQAELPLPGDMGAIIARMAGDPALLKDPRLANIRAPGTNAERPHELLLKANFTSRTDLEQIPYRDNLGNEGFFCHRPDAHVRLALPYVYSHGHEVPSGSDAESVPDAAKKSETPNSYYIFLRVAIEERLPGKPPFESFDLWQYPEDVCFKLVGGRYRAFGYSSNIVVVPKDTIATALRTLPQPSDR